MNHLVNILGIEFSNKRIQDMVRIIENSIYSQTRTFIVTANPEIVMCAQKYENLMKHIKTANYVVADGCGIILASRFLRSPILERITGYDLTVRLLRLSSEKKWRIYLLGGSEIVNKLAAKNILDQHPNLKLIGRHHGFFDWGNNEVLLEIQQKEPDIILVAMGCPRQEQWISENIPYCKKGIFIGVGGSIDVIAGVVKRAPLIWRKLNLEWLYRLIKQPSRWKRMGALPQFIILVLKLKWKLSMIPPKIIDESKKT
jgi:N-acetylglucosaminyldiphosphoundecaprenol N-acetyl-beta-D-mannosaminyltransferase